MFKKQEITLIENTSPSITAERRVYDKDLIRIGWTGAPWTRPDDLKIISKIKEYIYSNQSRFKLVHIGHLDKFMSFAEATGFKEIDIEKLPIQGHKEYLRSLDLDIGLAPLNKSCFNNFKSPIKILEYSTNSIPWIASRSKPYIDLCSKWQIKGRLCSKSMDWIDNIEELLDSAVRRKEGAVLKRLCDKYSSYRSGVEAWRRTIMNLMCSINTH